MNRLEKLKNEKWNQFSEGLKYFENASFESVYGNGWSAASAEYEKIIAELEEALEFYKTEKKFRKTVWEYEGHDGRCWLEEFEIYELQEIPLDGGSSDFGIVAYEALQKLKEFRGGQ